MTQYAKNSMDVKIPSFADEFGFDDRLNWTQLKFYFMNVLFNALGRLMPHFGRLLASLVLRRLTAPLEKLSPERQAGYRPGCKVMLLDMQSLNTPLTIQGEDKDHVILNVLGWYAARYGYQPMSVAILLLVSIRDAQNGCLEVSAGFHGTSTHYSPRYTFGSPEYRRPFLGYAECVRLFYPAGKSSEHIYSESAKSRISPLSGVQLQPLARDEIFCVSLANIWSSGLSRTSFSVGIVRTARHSMLRLETSQTGDSARFQVLDQLAEKTLGSEAPKILRSLCFCVRCNADQRSQAYGTAWLSSVGGGVRPFGLNRGIRVLSQLWATLSDTLTGSGLVTVDRVHDSQSLRAHPRLWLRPSSCSALLNRLDERRRSMCSQILECGVSQRAETFDEYPYDSMFTSTSSIVRDPAGLQNMHQTLQLDAVSSTEDV
ncbi:hypothetical protein CLF_112471 [Clonorchis sinensis]|uniref:Uncharacterized protein n=1 Tax=Clonorchis sinensis TaxID=79923 RepID=G7YMJ0_CLOSI|nr:hypothetical protein CLF_112471 [Clonorchis sinensis]